MVIRKDIENSIMKVDPHKSFLKAYNKNFNQDRNLLNDIVKFLLKSEEGKE